MTEHLEHPFEDFRRAEAAALEPDAWDYWIARAARIFGRSLDGNQWEDGYSLDYAHDAFKAGKSAHEYVESIALLARQP